MVWKKSGKSLEFSHPESVGTLIFVHEKFCILIKISLKFFLKGQIDNNPALVQIMACRQTGDKPFSESVMS